MSLHLDGVTLAYPPARSGRRDEPPVLRDLSLAIEPGAFVSVIGRSGSGKTSLLNLAAGFVAPSGGSVRVDGERVEGPGAERAVVFQDDALFPWASARDNVAFALRLRGLPGAERRTRAEALLASVGLAGAGDKAIWELSGGMRQRVGIARALAAEPRYLLMDEPLGALDAMTRERMHEFLLGIWQRSGAGILLITHGIEEALFLGTRVVVLAGRPGRIIADMPASYGRRFLRGEPARAIRADPAFVADRNALADMIHDEAERAA
ncbi:taurine ABC transporter ATP-binding protein [Antarcticirhabdus aurantiaca]|uniref:ATP-binding cassette domain-containing protein n=1 Tax=Antarcticirhabdus aurantiaca TaxID=2606717 RepID=A0ACD4NM67_9HYPH|nr:ATP-binding cassette domain-containing protein [Antarcticirhabdus aurantiaca]WAJ27844.1 ATP-binding cassette domain-containing protein [Jeongeuplla avenae]